MSEKVIREPINSTSTSNADRVYNSLSESDKELITALLNTALALFKGVQQLQEKSA